MPMKFYCNECGEAYLTTNEFLCVCPACLSEYSGRPASDFEYDAFLGLFTLPADLQGI
jgi:hypothetical protein